MSLIMFVLYLLGIGAVSLIVGVGFALRRSLHARPYGTDATLRRTHTRR